jgi:HEPN domain-containing protein
MKPHEQANALLGKAKQDLHAMRCLMADNNVADEIVGFHAQQTIEKAIKAVLAFRHVAYPFTHDLLALIDLVPASTPVFPVEVEVALALMPYSVAFRYANSPRSPLDRTTLDRDVTLVIDWARSIIES